MTTLITAQDDFVATLLQNRAELQQRLVEAQQHASAIKDKASSAREEQERLAGIRQLETQVTQARETYQEHLKAQEEAEKTLANLDAQLAQLKLHASSTQPVESLKTGVRAKADRSPPLVLVLINGTIAPFSDALIQKGTAGGREASSLLRGQIELDISSLSTEGEVKLLCFLYYDRLQIIPSLERSRIISNPSTWRNFVDGFSRVTGNFVIDVANSSPAEEHMAAVLSKLGFMPNVQQAYLAGVHPEHGISDVVEQQPDSTPRLGEAFVDQVMPKINLLRHLPLHAMGELADSTIELAGVFESSIALPLVKAGQRSVNVQPVPPSSTNGGGSRAASRSPTSAFLPLRQPLTTRTTIKLDPNRGLLNQDPTICFHHYVSPRGCTRKECSRSHDYEMTEGQLRRLREDVGTYPCKELRETGYCTHTARTDEICMFSHALDQVDALVADLITEQSSLARDIEQLEAVQPEPSSALAKVGSQEEQRQVRDLEQEREQYHGINLELELSVHDLRSRIVARTADVEAAKAAAPQAQLCPPGASVADEAPTWLEPVILVLIDGSSAPFNEQLIRRGWEGGRDVGERVRWEVEKDLREHDIELEEGHSDSAAAKQPSVLCLFWHNRKALLYNFKQSKVISNDGAWDSFLAGFNSVPTNHALDHGEASTCAAMALVISTIGRSRAVKRIYLAGVNLEELHETLPDLRPNKATLFHVDLVPKLVLVDHRETDDARETLLTSGWRVARFLRYFSSHHGLGGDLGWAYRPSTPILGPGDQCVA
ncbi:hypothetical protein JCM9279_004562 [Rhodotorula babjevae]